METAASEAEARNFLRAFSVTLIFLVGATLAGLIVCAKSLPPPRLSPSASFDAKARWLRGALRDHRCDALIIGSSMALNSFSRDVFAQATAARAVNLASWNMSFTDDYRILNIAASLCSPRLAIVSLYYGDLTNGDYDIDWDAAAMYIRGDNAISVYLRTLDPFSLVAGARASHGRRLMGRRIYDSLEFDDSGTVNLSAENFQVDEKRWEGYRHKPVAPAPARSLAALDAIVALARNRNFPLIVATVPMRQTADAFLDQAALENVWSSVRGVVARGGGHFVRIDNTPDTPFPDALFADYTHLNERGAVLWTRLVIERTQDVIAGVFGPPPFQAGDDGNRAGRPAGRLATDAVANTKY